jgi:hypothetical protein
MSAERLLTQHGPAQLIGSARLRRWVRAGWLAAVERRRGGGRFAMILFSPRDMRRILKRLERGERPAPDKLESARVMAARLRSNHRNDVARVRAVSGWDTFSLDF